MSRVRNPIPFGTASRQTAMTVHTGIRIGLLVVALLLCFVHVAVADDSGLNLTPEERAWLDAHPVVRARVGDAAPLHFFDGKPRGIAVDYLNLIAERVGFDVEYVYGIPWSTALEDIRNHEQLDLILTAKRTPERQDDMAFTEDYLLLPWVIFTRKDNPAASMEDLDNRIMAVERGYVMHQKLVDEYPGVTLLITETSLDALKAVATGEADAHIGNLTTVAYIIQYYNLINLQVSASTPFEGHDQAMAVRDDWPELVSILNKGLASISDAERVAIHQEWVPVVVQSQAVPGSEQNNTHGSLMVGLGIGVGGGLLLWLSLWLLGRLLPHGFRTTRSKLIGVTLLSLLLIMGVMSVWRLLANLEQDARSEIAFSLDSVVQTVERALALWIDGEKSYVRMLAANPFLTEHAKIQLESIPAWLELPASERARITPQKLAFRVPDSGRDGLQIISPSGTIIGSDHFLNIGERSDIADWSSAQLSAALSGQTIVVPPLASTASASEEQSGEDTKYHLRIITPIMDSAGSVIAVLALQYDIDARLGSLLQAGWSGATREVYVIDRMGWLISESRFDTSSSRTNALTETGNGSAPVRAAIPGVSLDGGHNIALPQREWPLTLMASAVVNGLSGTNAEGYLDYRGIPVFGAWAWLPGLQIGLATEVDTSEALSSFRKSRAMILAVVGLVVLLACLLVAFLIWSGERATKQLRQARNKWELIAAEKTAKLSLSSERLELAARAGNIGVWDWDITGDALIWDETMYALYGTNKDDSRGAYEIWIKGVHPDDREMLKQHVQTALRSEEIPGIELRIVWPDGTIRYIREICKVSRDENDKAQRMIGVTWDITKRKRVEIELQAHAAELKESNEALEKSRRAALSLMQDANTERQRTEKTLAQLAEMQDALRASEELSRLLLDSAGEGIFGIDLDGKVTFSNPAATRMLGFSTEELLGHGVHKMVHHSHADGTIYPLDECPMAKTHSEGTRHHVEDEVLWRKNGTSFYVDYTSTPIRKDGELVGAVVTFSDITERKQFERQSLLTKQRLETLLRVAEHEIMDVADFLDYALDQALDLTSSRLGYIYFYDENTEEFELNTWSKQVMPECHVIDPQTKYHLDKAGLWGEVVRQQKSIIVNDYSLQHPLAKGTPEGHVPLKRFMSVPVFEEGKIVAVVGVANRTEEYDEIDVRQLNLLMSSVWKMVKAFEYRAQLVVARDAAEAANRAKSDFLSNMSHELRTPLNAIIGFSEILEDEKLGRLVEAQKRAVSNILTSGRHLLALINDILDLAKVEAGKMELDLSVVQIGPLVRESLVLIQEKAMKHSIRLRTEIEDCVAELKIQADARKLKQILFNLLSNAAKFTPDGGEITVGAKCEEDLLVVFVRDTGIGIAPDQLERVFGEFEQIDSGYSRAQHGTGLGLALTRRFVELHGGRIWAESEGEGKGSTFTFTIPIRQEETDIEEGTSGNGK